MKAPGFIKVAQREIVLAGGNKSMRNLLIVIPITVFVLLAFIYIQGGIQEIEVAILDEDRTELSRTIISFLDATEQMKVSNYLSSSDELDNFFMNNKQRAIFWIPKDTEKNIISGRGANVRTFTNSSNIIFGNVLLREAYTVIGTVSAGATINRLVASGLTEEQALNLAVPIAVNSKPLYNPVYNYLYYLVPGLLTVLLQMIMFFISARAINSEVNKGTYLELYSVSNESAINIVLGKALAYLYFGLGVTAFIAVLFVVFGIPFQDMILELIILFVVFLLSNIFLGLMVSSTIDDEILALDISFFYNSPAFVFSGFTFPMFGMPFFDSLYAQFIPYTHFLNAFFKVYQIGAPIDYIFNELVVLCLFCVVGFLTAVVAINLRISQVRKKEKMLLNA